MIQSSASRIAGSLLGAALFAAWVATASSAVANPYATPEDDWGTPFSRSLTVGGMMIVQPKFEGSDEHDVFGVPMIIPRLSDPNDTSLFGQFRKRVSFKGIDDIRFRAVGLQGFEVGPVAGYRTGRDEDDGDRLRGLGDVDDGLALGGYVGYRIGNLLFDASATTQVTGDDTGVLVRFGAEAETRLSPDLLVTTRLGTTLASDDYAESFFGVSAAQAARSLAGLPIYDAGSGLKDVFVDVNAKYDLSQSWVLQVGGRYARLIGDAADSPIIETEDQFTGRIGLGYRFALDRH